MFAIGESRLVPDDPGGYPNGNHIGADIMIPGIRIPTIGLRWYYGLYPRRHGKNYNQHCCDGHVEALDPDVLFDARNRTAMRWHTDHQMHPEMW
jgi:hypothetical protein